MQIIVCIKQVPETTEVKINLQTNTLIREGVKSIINPFDMYAIEEAIRLKEKFGGKTIVITMGPPQAEEALREALSMGIDEAILITDRAFAGSDTWATSYTLSLAIKKIAKFDIILCGKQASDGDTAQVGPGIAGHLDIPQVTFVKKIEKIENGTCQVQRMTEEGYEIISVSLPVLLTVVKEINEPRLPSLKGMLRAKKQEVIRWNAKDLGADSALIGLEGSPTRVIKVFHPPVRTGGIILRGDTEETTEKLVELLKEHLR
ncbi:MAG: electron transfer flavoprotein subunit beta/FixA family protein [Candidatus Omnitrophica bacterium]|nr:electron transfer flavoprotein subunit beta/FixA family protein [Candidatus Omnitrophota bacterium]